MLRNQLTDDLEGAECRRQDGGSRGTGCDLLELG